MRQEPLTGYILHARAYQEKRAIYQLFSREYGIVQGVGVRSVPSFVLLTLFATGKNALKSFSQIQPSAEFSIMPTTGRVQYALLYMNEVLHRLLVAENPCPSLWQVYHDEVANLRHLDVNDAQAHQQMKRSLRCFERALFDELGVGVDFELDGMGRSIAPDVYYRFVPEVGFVPTTSTLINQAKDDGKRVNRRAYLGLDLCRMGQADIDGQIYIEHLDDFGQLQKDVIDYLLDYKPLNSRKLWQQSLNYQMADDS